LSAIKNFLLKLPVIGEYIGTRDSLAVPGALWALPGHFYSPIPSLAEVAADEERIFAGSHDVVTGVVLNESLQLELLKGFLPFYRDIPFKAEPSNELRYHFDNDWYGWSDAIFLYCMMRQFRPRRMIEVGSGFSSALMLDVNDAYFDGAIDLTFIDPNPERLRELLKPTDVKVKVLPKRVQDVDLAIFQELEENDILFIDSSHVSKVGSDVNYLYLEVLPRLRPGVLIHVHDVFAGFEYPSDWVYEGRAWNEQYLLRALLIGTTKLDVLLMNDLMQQQNSDWFDTNMPMCQKQHQFGSIWLRVR
jgi:predicted O-methyltransferase YrrM